MKAQLEVIDDDHERLWFTSVEVVDEIKMTIGFEVCNFVSGR